MTDHAILLPRPFSVAPMVMIPPQCTLIALQSYGTAGNASNARERVLHFAL